MPRKSKKPRPRVYHDGLIPTAGEHSQSYPEVVPDDHNASKHEKSYPEVAPPPSPPPQQQTPPAAAALTPPPQELSGASPQTIVPALPLPRPSGVHSLRQAWSEVGDLEDTLSLDDRPPLWKRPIVWVVVIALAIIVTLAGILGGVASGAIKTAWNNKSSSQPSPSPSVPNPTCPSANNLNYTAVVTTSSSSSPSQQKIFRIQCGANYPGGDGSLGLQKNNPSATDSLAGCLDACAREAGCVGAAFDGGGCWLKEFIGVVKTGPEMGGVVSGVLWQ